jgi:hypothetical protein
MKLRAIEYVMSQDKSKQSAELELAKNLKKEFDTRFHCTWQCVVGNFNLIAYTFTYINTHY